MSLAFAAGDMIEEQLRGPAKRVKSIKIRDIGTRKETKIVEWADGRIIYHCPFVDFINQTLKPTSWGRDENVMCAAIRDHMVFSPDWLERWRTRVE